MIRSYGSGNEGEANLPRYLNNNTPKRRVAAIKPFGSGHYHYGLFEDTWVYETYSGKKRSFREPRYGQKKLQTLRIGKGPYISGRSRTA